MSSVVNRIETDITGSDSPQARVGGPAVAVSLDFYLPIKWSFEFVEYEELTEKETKSLVKKLKALENSPKTTFSSSEQLLSHLRSLRKSQ